LPFSSTPALAGDTARAVLYDSEHAAKLKDVTIRIVKDELGSIIFKGKFVLKFTKGYK
jgi:hypothetical protein